MFDSQSITTPLTGSGFVLHCIGCAALFIIPIINSSLIYLERA